MIHPASRTAFVTGGSGFLGGYLIDALRRNSWEVRALARSPKAERAVVELGAEPVRGDLDDERALRSGLEGADAVVHSAALFVNWAKTHEFERANVEGTRRLLGAAVAARSVKRFVQVGTAAVTMRGHEDLRRIDETAPVVEPPFAPYIATKARAERLVLAANGTGGLLTSVVRPATIWGAGMPMLEGLVRDARAGRLAWPNGGGQIISTSHAGNVAHAAVLALSRGRGGEAYFVTDGEDRPLKEAIGALVDTRDVTAGDRSVPMAIAWPMAAAMEAVWRLLRLGGEPPLTRQLLRIIGHEFTLDIAKARRELGYAPVVGWEEGLAQMRAAALEGSARTP